MKYKFQYLLLILLSVSMSTFANAQSSKITVDFKESTLEQIIKEIGQQASLSIVYNVKDIDTQGKYSIKATNEDASVVVERLLKNSNVNYTIKDNHLVLSAKQTAKAQQSTTRHKVTGNVVDEAGESLIGVSIAIKGSSTGTITNIDGDFSIDVPNGSELEVSYIGYMSQKFKITKGQDLKVVLKEDTKTLDEVVVTALGIKRAEKALSYNVQQVKGDELTSIKDANFMNSISGKVAGVNIQRSSAGVGGSTRVVMRGNKSIMGDNNVLYVVDGIPIGNQADRSGSGTGFGGMTSGEGISNFNPDDIESISVLTGPSAAALYGASAANGVILINTKKGKEGKVRVNVNSSFEAANAYILPEFQNTYGNKSGDSRSWGDKLATPTSYDPKDFFNTGNTFNNSFNISAGTEKNQTYFSASAINATGVVPNNKYHRYNVTLRNTAKFFNDKLTIDASASYVREFANNMVSFGTYFNPIVGAYLYPRGQNFEQEKYFERYNENLGYSEQYWSPGDMGMDIQNPYWIAYRNIRPEAKDRYMFYGQAKYDLTNWLNIAGRVRLDNTYTEKEDKRYASTINTFAKPKGRYTYSNSTFKQKYADIMVNLDKDLNTNFHLTANIGSSFEEYDTKGRGYGGQLLLVPNKFTYTNIDPTNSTPSEIGGNSRTRNFAMFGSTELSWNSALYLTLTGRGDKPSQLVNSKNEWIFYPSIGLSALVTELLSDDVQQRIKPVLSFLKVRTSYTEVGSPIPFTGLTPGTITHNISGGAVDPYEYYPVSDLKAERTRSYELGVDSKWFNNILSIGVTLYKSNTYNQLLKAQLSKGSGYNYMFVQAGNVQNKGIEINLGLSQSFKDFEYNTVLTATANRNKIKELAHNVKNPVDPTQILDLSDIQMGRFRLREGGQIGDLYADEWLKRDDENHINYNKEDGDQLLTESTTPYKIGSVNPKWNLGWNTTLSYKGFSFNMLFNARIGGQVISKTQAMLDKFGVSKVSAQARDAGGVQVGDFVVDPKTYYESVSNLDAYYVYSATNVRLQEARLSYSFPKKWFNNIVNDLSLSVYGTNLWMLYNKAPFDPELTASTGTFGQGYDYFMLPSQRTFGVGLKVGF